MKSCFSLSASWCLVLVVCGILCVGARSWSLGANLLQDPSFEDGPPRTVETLERPWGGEEAKENAVRIVRGSAHTGSQSARMQAASQAVLWQRFPTTPNTEYTAACWIRAEPALGVGDDSPALSIRRTDVICPVEECDDDGNKEGA